MKKHKNDPDTWGINPRQKKHIGEIALGDIVFIWLTKYKYKETRGVYAMGIITGLPDKNRQSFPYEHVYWVNKQAQQRYKQKILLELEYTFPYTDKLIHNPILKGKLEEAGLCDLLVIKRPRGTSICEVPGGCETIKKMVETR
jgi:hypothetical protein